MAGILDSFKLNGKVAIVTGCERGLGQGMAIALAEAGADIFGVSYPADAAETAAKVEGAGRKFVYMQANLLSIEPIPAIFKAAVAAYGRVDIVVNNAGIIKRNDAID